MRTHQSVPFTFLRVDEVVQRILGICVLLGMFYFPIAMMLLIPFGFWQCCSGVVGCFYRSAWRMKYVAFVLFYFLFIASTYLFMDFEHIFLIKATYTIVLLLSPLLLGVGYYIKTKKELKMYLHKTPQFDGLVEVLDIDF